MRKRVAAVTGSAACFVFLAFGAAQAQPADGARGETIFNQRCTGCHTLGKSGIGPDLTGVMTARKARPAFNYSPAMAKQPVKWTADRLNTFLAAPQNAVPGCKMTASVPNAADRSAVIAYLKRLK